MEENQQTPLGQIFSDFPLVISDQLCLALDGLSAALAKLASGVPLPESLAAGLEQITQWLSTAASPAEGTPAECAPAPGAWTASYLGAPEMGGSVECRRENQVLFFSLDAAGRPYQGVWEDTAAGAPGQELHFWLEDAPAGTQLMLKSALGVKQFPLPALSAGSAWARERDFLQALSSLRTPMESTQAPVPDLSTGADHEPAGLKCARCGSPLKPGKKFCGNCGAPVTPPPAEKICPQCGKTLSSSARFCGKCGSPQP